MFKLSATLRGHDDDVRSVTALQDGSIVTGSRDSTVRIWRKDASEKFDTSVINFKSDGFVNTLATFTDENTGGELIVCAGNDKLINLTNPQLYFDGNINTANEYCLIGHEANICSLDVNGKFILSASWDCTARVWNKDTGEVVYILKGHENSVWSAKFINGSKDEILTCGADRTVRKWKGSKQVKCIIAHDDVVRDLIVLPNGDFITCSNDTSIKVWDGVTFETKAILVGHQNFIYSLSLLPNGDLVSCGEDRSIRIWRDNQCIQIIILPCVSVWKVFALSNGDIVSGSSDSIARIFTRESSRYASEIEQTEFMKSLEESSVSEAVADVNKEKLPGIEALQSKEAKVEGETRAIKTAVGTVELYQWTDSKWNKIGQLVESSSSSGKQKQFYNGSFYDYVFNIDVEDGKPPLKLPVNVIDNPYEVADKFLADNDLPSSYLQQIVDFILQNADGVKLDSPVNVNSVLPQREYLTFESTDIAKILNAFKKLNSKQNAENQISDNLETLYNCEDFNAIQDVSMRIIENWEIEDKLLGFDILRAIITKVKPNELLFPILRSGLDEKTSNIKIEMMTIRILINTFAAKTWGEQMMLDEDVFEIIFTPYLMNNLAIDSKFLPITVSTLLLNYSVLINKFQLIGMHDKVIKIIRELIKIPTIVNNVEASYRLLVAVGTLNYTKNMPDVEIIVSKLYKNDDARFKTVKGEIK
ncbi:hypothetical protein CANINC_000382 [Pichia inconspicua]|uniref:PUL domain-containing protein n=1 Tax=Pichia inconspicua TaxID=52247 RepID=A0A4T0X6A3_9ASCO|nr:hypothetical protein CANINC_000382 [[Candida] inconspicua]